MNNLRKPYGLVSHLSSGACTRSCVTVMSVALLMSHPARVMAQTAGQLDSTVLAATTVQPDGWVHYSKTLVDELDLNGKSTHLVNGRLGIDGTCTIGESGTVEAGSLGHYSEPIASSMRTCQEIVVSGELTPSAIARLASAAAAGPKGLAPMTGTAIRPMTSSVFPLATATSKAYTGSRWVDPAFIVITALTIDLSWQRSGSSVPSAGYTIKPYEFAWDGWGNSGTPHPPFTFGAGFVSCLLYTSPSPRDS